MKGTLLLLNISVKWTVQESLPPKYLHYDPITSHQLMCDQCPPGTFVKQHCTASAKTECAHCPDQSYTDEWNDEEECNYCNVVCKELQYEKIKCTSTGNRVCECVEGRYLNIEFCLRHTACPPGFGVVKKGRFIVPKKLSSTWLNTLMDSLPGEKINLENREQIKQKSNLQDQTFQLLKLWKEQNKDHSTVKNIVQGINLCENNVLKHIDHLNITLEHLNILLENLPGKNVGREEMEQIFRMCKSTEPILKLLNLWRIKNKDQDTIKSLMFGLKHLKSYRFPKTTIQSFRKVVKFLHSLTMQKLYQNLFLEMVGNQVHLVKMRRG
ncbi:hypothetical protein E2320_011644 [Naja naja]|nr:hypothetical protein E2320_011644 [Naja naja]